MGEAMTFHYDGDVVALIDIRIAGESTVLWNRRGEIRMVPGAMIRNARQTLESWLQMHGRDLSQVPTKLTTIRWVDCLGLPEGSGKVEVG